MTKRRSPISPSKRYLTDWRIETFLWFAAAAVICLLIGAALASAKDAGQFAGDDPAIRAWYAAQHNSRGQWCCDKADGHDYFDTYEMLPDGGVRLADGTTLPAYMVLTARDSINLSKESSCATASG